MSTYIIGKILDPTEFCIRSFFERIINGLLGTFANDFIPRSHPHITINYIGNDLNKLEEFKNNVNLRSRLQKYIGQKCVFTKLGFYGKTLVYSFKFENDEINNGIYKLMEEYNPNEKDSHGDNRLHIAFGKFKNDNAKKWFVNNLLSDIEDIINNKYSGQYSDEFSGVHDLCKLNEFQFNDFDIVEITENKSYIKLQNYC